MSTDRKEQGEESGDARDLAGPLAAMTQWDGDSGAVWKAALEKSGVSKAHPAGGAFARWTMFQRLTGLAAAVVLGAIGLYCFSAMRANPSMRVAMSAAPTMEMERRVAVSAKVPASPQPLAMSGSGLMRGSAASAMPNPAPGGPGVEVVGAQRSVVRKATIELKTRDVRAVFVKAAQVLSEANGEYIEQSSLTGQGTEVEGSLTLRVDTARLSGVLNALRALGDVTTESSGGEDITNQVVDTEARLRNEQRVEVELLGLMESRKEAPLKEILELRDSISNVRESIERLTGQREKYSRLVSLATVLVIIRPDTTAAAPLPQGIADYFGKQVKRAWEGSLGFLADSVAFLISVVVGGAVFWVLAGVAVVAAMTMRRRALRKRGIEGAPVLGS